MPKTAIVSDKAPKGPGLYSPAVRAGDFIFVSGQVAIDPETDATLSETIEGQTRHAFGQPAAAPLRPRPCTRGTVRRGARRRAPLGPPI